MCMGGPGFVYNGQMIHVEHIYRQRFRFQHNIVTPMSAVNAVSRMMRNVHNVFEQ